MIVLTSLQILYVFKYDVSNEMLMLQNTIHSTMDFDKKTGLLISTPEERSAAAAQGGKIVTASLYTGDLSIQQSNFDLSQPVATEDAPEKLLTIRKRAEEELLYGKPLPDEDQPSITDSPHNTPDTKKVSTSDAIMSHMTAHYDDSATDNGQLLHSDFIDENQNRTTKSYVVIADRSGRVSFILLEIESMEAEPSSNNDQMDIDDNGENRQNIPCKIFQSIPLGSLANLLEVGIDDHPQQVASATSPPLPPPRRFVTAVSLAVIGAHSAGDSSLSAEIEAKLCLVVVLNSGDVVVYAAVTSASESLTHFQKLGHSLITRRKKSRAVARLKRTTSSGSRNHLGGGGDQYLDLDCEMTSQSMLSIAKDTRGQVALMISGARPLLVCSMRGMIQVVPFCLPELPYAGVGMHVSNYFTIGSTKGYSVLWREDKIENNSRGNDTGNTATSLSTLGLYTVVEGAIQIPGSDMSVVRTKVGRTTHKVCEFIQSRTDDSTQQALLKTKTFVMLCSEKVSKAWTQDVLSAEERADEEGTYDRFYKQMQSFCEPSSSFGPPPALEVDVFSVCIMQGDGVVVDKFPLPEGERVLDMTIVYLTVEESEATVTNTAPTSKKKAFVAVCTSIDDKHGEDTQGEGRLLLFSLDYALYHEDQKDSADQEGPVDEDADNKDGADKVDDSSPESKSTDIKEEDTTIAEVSTTSTVPVSSVTVTAASAAQARFLGAIKPKLRLTWTGPGPGSVVVPFRDNYLLATVGATLYLYQFNTDTKELEQIAFFFAQFYISTLSVMKDYILIGDACQSVQFVVWRQEDMSLTLLAKDYDRSSCVAANYVLDGDTLSFVVSDDEANMQLMRFNPK